MARSTLLFPGFRFHPTDVELAVYFLKRKLLGKFIFEAIAEVNIYDFSPWDLPDKSILRSGDLEWYFFCPKSKKYSSGCRTNRATETGFWKATGKDRVVEYKQETVAMIKTLVFHLGHAPKGQRTDWVMHEYRMADKKFADAGVVQDTYVLCKIFEKSGAGPKNGAQYGAPFNEEEWNDDDVSGQATATAMAMATTGTALNPKQSSAAAVSWSSTEPGGPSSITMASANETKVDEDAMFTHEDVASIMGGSPINGNNKDKVEIIKDSPNEEDTAIYEDLANLNNLEELDEGSFNIFGVDRDDYTLDDLDTDAIFTAADLDFDI